MPWRSEVTRVLLPMAMAGALSCGVGQVIADAGQVAGEKGQVVLAIDTDMVAGEDITSVQVEVFAGDAEVDGGTNKYDVSDAGLRLPATFAVVEGSQNSVEATIRLTGFKADKAVIFREAKMVVPSSSRRLLRMPLEWVNLGPKCPEGQTRLAGTCRSSPSISDTSEPKEFNVQEVFGGGDEHGNGGTCFPSAACFEKALTGMPTSYAAGRCTISDPGGSSLNIGLRIPPGNGGTCASNNCFIPLNKVDSLSDGVFGWRYADDKKIEIPAELCLSKKDAYVSIVASRDDYPSKTEKFPVCSSAGAVKNPMLGKDAGTVIAVDGGGDAAWRDR